MQYRILKADALFNGQTFSKAHTLIVREDGVIEDVLYNGEAHSDAEIFSGILCPGFINSHCHLELSHLKDVIPPGTGLIPFLIDVVSLRGASNALKQDRIAKAETEMQENGIVAVADICNTADTLSTKQGSAMQWYNLVEVLNFYDDGLERAFAQYGGVKNLYEAAGLRAVLTPHAPYTISKKTFEKLNETSAGKIISVHNCETPAEHELFERGTGAFLKLYQHFGKNSSPFEVTGRSSLQSWLPYFTQGQTIVLVHNSFMQEADILFAKAHAAQYGLRLIYCLCPNANLYIENALPPVGLLMKHDCNIVLGTDSYSSNWQLNILSEIATLRKYFPHIALETMLRWATANGATAWGFEKVGSFTKGYKPGVLLLDEKKLSVKKIL